MLPGAVFSQNCRVSYDFLNNHTAGVTTEFLFYAQDAYGNNQTTSEEASKVVIDMRMTRLNVDNNPVPVRGCTANAMLASTCSFTFKVIGGNGSATDGSYLVRYTTVLASDYQTDFVTSVRFCADPTQCSDRYNIFNPTVGAYSTTRNVFAPFVLHVEPGATAPVQSTAYGVALQGGTVGTALSFTVVARDAYGNRRTLGGDPFYCIIYGPGTTGTLGDIPVVDAGDGTYLFTFTAKVVGMHSIIVLMGPDSIANSPFTPTYRATDGPLVPGQTRLVNRAGVELYSLPALVAGTSQTCYVQAYTAALSDGSPSPKLTGGDVLTVAVRTLAGTIAAPVTDLNNGAYSFSVGNLTAAGSYAVVMTATCTSCGTAVSGSLRASPYLLVVNPSVSTAATISAVELANPASLYNWYAGSVITFTIQARDRYGNALIYDIAADNRLMFDAKLVGADGGTTTTVPTSTVLGNKQLSVAWDHDGVYYVSFMVYTAQRYTVTVAFQSSAIVNTPTSVTVAPNVVDPASCTVSMHAVGGSVGTTYRAMILAMDAFGNKQTGGGVDFHADLTMATSITWDRGFGPNPLTVAASANPTASSVYVKSQNGTFTFVDGFAMIASMTVTDLNSGYYAVDYMSQQVDSLFSL